MPFRIDDMIKEAEVWINLHGKGVLPPAKGQLGTLGRWMRKANQEAKEGKLSTGDLLKIRRLGLGVSEKLTSRRNVKWETDTLERIEHLKRFKLKNGHLEVPLGCNDHKGLGVWVNNFRRTCRKNIESPRVKLVLREFPDFPYSLAGPSHSEEIRSVYWIHRFEEFFLMTKKLKRLPSQHSKDANEARLGRWFLRQTLSRKNNQLSAVQQDAIERILKKFG